MELSDLIFVLLYIFIAWKLLGDDHDGGSRSRIPAR